MLWLGVDVGSQSIKVAVFDSEGNLVEEHSVKYDEELGKYGTEHGQIVLDKNGKVRAPALMWFEALDMALDKLESSNLVELGEIRAISGDAQQHSSVWWSTFPEDLDPSRTIAEQMEERESLALHLSPVWADSSTTLDCEAAEQRIGGREEMVRRTGSVAIERFTGGQISKVFSENPDAFESTSLIQLLSTAVCSVFAGRPAPTDFSDAAGMNLMDISGISTSSFAWLEDADSVFGVPGLHSKLGELCPSTQVVGSISPYFVERYGFSDECEIVAFTGDNPATLIGSTDQTTDIVISLGTSDTVLLQVESARDIDVSAGGISIFPHPTELGMYMVMICFKNGGAVRASEKTNERTWDEVEEILENQPEEEDVLCFFYPQTEIAPRVVKPCERAFSFEDGAEIDVDSLTWSQRVRGVFILRALSIRSILSKMDISFERIILTGGGSKSEATQAIFQEILSVPVFALEDPGAAARGSAMKACIAINGENPSSLELHGTKRNVHVPNVDLSLFAAIESQLN